MLELRHSYPSQLSSGPLSTLVLWPLHQKPQPLSPGGILFFNLARRRAQQIEKSSPLLQLLWLAHQTASDWLAQELHESSGEEVQQKPAAGSLVDGSDASNRHVCQPLLESWLVIPNSA